MRKILLFAILLGSSSTFSQQTTETIQINATNRSFIYYEPSIYNPSTDTVPVLFIFHGLGDNALNMTGTGFNLVADTANMIPVYMDGVLNPYGQTSWNNGTLLSSTADDMAFVEQVLDSISTWYNIDTNRIYATGFSMGSIMSHHLACENEKFDAIAGVGGTMATTDISGCSRTTPMRVMHMHGTADPTVPYDTGALPSLSLVPETLAFWKNYNGCQDSIGHTIENSVSDGITVDWFVYGGCNPESELEHWKLNGAGHIFPYPPVNDVFATTIIWHFLEQYDHGYLYGFLSTNDFDKNVNISVSPNPAKNNLTIESEELIQQVLIHDVSGQLVKSTTCNDYVINENISNLLGGVYFVYVQTNNGGNSYKVVKE